MLVLSRKTKQSVMVGGIDKFLQKIKVTVLEIEGSRVRLGFEAPDDVPVYRYEVWERIDAERNGDVSPDAEAIPVGS
jgi:carbon storage regulator